MQEALPLNNLTDFFRVAGESDTTYPYSVAWIDSLATGDALGRGVFLRGEHAPATAQPQSQVKSPWLGVPFTPPLSLINRPSLKVFNTLYRAKALAHPGLRRVGYSPFFFPLDSVANWNRIYGPKGLRQHQSVIPMAAAEPTMPLSRRSHHERGAKPHRPVNRRLSAGSWFAKLQLRQA